MVDCGYVIEDLMKTIRNLKSEIRNNDNFNKWSQKRRATLHFLILTAQY